MSRARSKLLRLTEHTSKSGKRARPIVSTAGHVLNSGIDGVLREKDGASIHEHTHCVAKMSSTVRQLFCWSFMRRHFKSSEIGPCSSCRTDTTTCLTRCPCAPRCSQPWKSAAAWAASVVYATCRCLCMRANKQPCLLGVCQDEMPAQILGTLGKWLSPQIIESSSVKQTLLWDWVLCTHEDGAANVVVGSTFKIDEALN